MTISDEQLMTLVDEECSPEERATLEARIAADPALSRRYAAQAALRDRLRGSFDAVLEEPVPQRLLDAASAARPRRFEPIWFAAAASLAAGMVLGPFMLKLVAATPQVVFRQGQMMADGALAQVLSRQLAADPSSSGPVRVGVSFVSKAGQYCRTFVDGRERGAVAGLACRDGDRWRLKVLESVAETPAARGTYTQAATSLSPGVVQAAEALMNGDPLDAAGEAAARASGWQASRPASRGK